MSLGMNRYVCMYVLVLLGNERDNNKTIDLCFQKKKGEDSNTYVRCVLFRTVYVCMYKVGWMNE